MKRLLTLLLLLALLLSAGLLVARSKSIVAMAADDKPSPTAVFLQYEDGFIPVTLFQNGESLIRYCDDVNYTREAFYNRMPSFWRYGTTSEQFQQFKSVLADESFFCYSLPEHEKTQTLSFQQLQKQLMAPPHTEDKSLASPLFIGIATNNSSPQFFANAEYSCYTANEQQYVPDRYIQYVRKKLNTAGLFNTPVVIQELWEFDFDSDGKKEAVIFASNLPSVKSEKIAAISDLPRFKQGLGYYTYSLFYSETLLPMDFSSEISFLRQNNFNFSKDDERIYEAEESFVYQFDAQGHIQAFRSWSRSKSPTISRPFLQTAICDFNHDGRYDLGIFYGTNRQTGYEVYESSYKIYLQKDNGRLQYLGGCKIF